MATSAQNFANKVDQDNNRQDEQQQQNKTTVCKTMIQSDRL